MPRKRKASKARVGNIQGARDALSGKQQKSESTPAGSDISDDDEKRESGDEIVCLSLKIFLNTPKLTTSDGQQRQGG